MGSTGGSVGGSTVAGLGDGVTWMGGTSAPPLDPLEVGLIKRLGVFDAVGVMDEVVVGVAVLRGVTVAVVVGVRVGIVAVGNGPINACAVLAIAVLVLAIFFWSCNPSTRVRLNVKP